MNRSSSLRTSRAAPGNFQGADAAGNDLLRLRRGSLSTSARTFSPRHSLDGSQLQKHSILADAAFDAGEDTAQMFDSPIQEHMPHNMHPHSAYDLGRDLDDPTSSTSDFVKRLYRMLEDKVFPDIVLWAPAGDSFIIKDMNDFTKYVLPRMFKHSNFASFVRQLNKYDFHKIKNTEEGKQNDQSWVFQHPHFKSGHIELLENVKRKIPPQRKVSAKKDAEPSPEGPRPEDPLVHSLQARVDGLTRNQDELQSVIRTLDLSYRTVLKELIGVQQTVAQQEGVMATLMQYFMDSQSNRITLGNGAVQMIEPANPTGLAQTSLEKLNELSRRAAQAQARYRSHTPTPLSQRYLPVSRSGSGDSSVSSYSERRSAGSQSQDSNPSMSSLDDFTGDGDDKGDAGLEVYTLGGLVPRTPDVDLDLLKPTEAWSLNGPSLDPQYSRSEAGASGAQQNGTHSTGPQGSQHHHQQSQSQQQQQQLRVRRSTYVPSWAVSPRVLLVDDDVVNRTVSSRFLQVAGCTIDVAVDGVAAVNKMNLAKYDLVLMDIVMPKLDGLSATSLIRQFDALTPIISMTGNSTPSDVMNYYSHGMTDILSKPFTRDGLVNMLEKHLNHLMSVWDSSNIPRSPGLPPLADAHFREAFMSGALSAPEALATAPSNASITNPLAPMGVSDVQYSVMVQNYVNSDAFPGSPSDTHPSQQGQTGANVNVEADDRKRKRGRFEAVE